MELMSNNKNIVLRLELNGSLLHEVQYKDITDEITIGRHNDCTWHIPATDRTASNHHARIFRKKGSVYIADAGSRNGIFFKGQKITQRKISVDEQYMIGDCKLFVELQNVNTKSVHEFNRLEQLNGQEKGKIYNLQKDFTRIGSDVSCDIVINDQVISAFHVEIEQKSDQSAWIRDLQSRNGSSVNGEPLSSSANDSGRLLKDGDIISIAYIEMRYWDKHVEHVRSHLFLKIAAVVVTAAILLGGYFVFRMGSKPAKWYVSAARSSATAKQFNAALEYLNKAEKAEGSDIHRYEIAELKAHITKWQETVKKWQDIRKLLENKQWITANQKLSPLVSGDMEFWRWNNTDATTEKNEALNVKQFLDIFLKSRGILTSNESTLPELQAAHRSLAKELTRHTGGLPGHTNSLRNSAKDILAELDETIKCWQLIVSNIAEMQKTYDIKTALQNISQARKKMEDHINLRKKRGARVSPRIIAFANEYLRPLKDLAVVQILLDENYVYCARMQFDKILKELPVPGINECSIDPVLSDIRRTFIVLNTQLNENAVQLRNIVMQMQQMGLSPEKKPGEILHILRKQVLDAILRCDTLDHPLVSWNRQAGAGEFDKVLGTEIFFDYLRALPDEFDTSKLNDLKFRPILFIVRDCYARLKAFLAFAEQENMTMVCNNKCSGNLVAEWVIYADDMLKERKRFINKLRNIADSGSDRRAVIAGGLALLLDENLARNSAEVEKLSKKVKNIRRQVSDILRKANSPEATIRARKQVLLLGIPGDSLLKQPWAEAHKK